MKAWMLPSVIWLGWFWRPLRVLMLAVAAFSLLAVFLCLAALYESWTIPLAVILVVPLGVLGVVLGNLALVGVQYFDKVAADPIVAFLAELGVARWGD